MGLRERIRALAVKYPRYGYRRAHVMLIRDGYLVNHKRVQRLWRLEGLHVQRPKRRKPQQERWLCLIRYASNMAPHSFYAWTTDQSSLPTLCAPGVENKTFKPTIATRVHHGKRSRRIIQLET